MPDFLHLLKLIDSANKLAESSISAKSSHKLGRIALFRPMITSKMAELT